MNINSLDLIVLGLFGCLIAAGITVLVNIVRFCTHSNPRLAKSVGGIVAFVGAIPIVYSTWLFTSFGGFRPFILLRSQAGFDPFILLARSTLISLPVMLAGIWLVLSPTRGLNKR
jgi:hypothetical protein